MYPEPISQYFVPRSVQEVADLLAAHPQATLLAGGQSLLQQLKSRARSAETIIDLNRLVDGDAINMGDDTLCLGALARYRDILSHPEIATAYGALADAVSEIGDRQVRNRGTAVGSLANADPTGDIAPVALVFDAELRVLSDDTGDVPFDPATVAGLGFIRAVTLHRRGGSAFVKHNRVAQDRATVNAAAALDVDESGRCRGVRVAIGGIPPHAVRLAEVESLIEGEAVTRDLANRVAEAAAEALTPQSDLLASAAYRTQLIRASVPAVLQAAYSRAGGSIS